ncbi:MAG: nucleoside-diphosphate sugar epimerase/dehydratase [Pseudomonadota bacterium]
MTYWSRLRRLIPIALLDAASVSLALWLAFAARYGEWWPDSFKENNWLIIIAVLSTLWAMYVLGGYRARVRFMEYKLAYDIAKAVTTSVLVLTAVVLMTHAPNVPRSGFFIYWAIAVLMLGSTRALGRTYTERRLLRDEGRDRVVIYGAGDAGTQLVRALQAGKTYLPVAFLDDNAAIQRSEIWGLRVHAPRDLEKLIERDGVKHVLLAIPSATRKRKQEILNLLADYPLHVRTVPDIQDLVSGHLKIDAIREVELEDLLGREPVPPVIALIEACIKGKNIMVTGAGGSIGSELCRQILRYQPKSLVLFERTEYALYEINRELESKNLGIPIVPVLGSVNQQAHVEAAIDEYSIQTIYHAAAYKHVPLVELNPTEGIYNNVFGTLHTARAALNKHVETFVLISTDKAVRPTSVMGASKRLAEMVLQAIAAETPGKTCFSMVRFGNVLGSSGSVIPLFREQIRNGGPVTVTHKDVTRYFMTIEEASQLVIQAGAMAKGGEVFVLDMGEPVKIIDMARRMIHLSGLSVRDEENPQGDIEIAVTGLRPGEKLFEELLIGDNVSGTNHPRILQAEEEFSSWSVLERQLGTLEVACSQLNLDAARSMLWSIIAAHIGNDKNTSHDIIAFPLVRKKEDII